MVNLFIAQPMRRSLLCLAIASLTFGTFSSKPVFGQLSAIASSLNAGAGAFPNEWYVRDGEGLEELRNLEGKPAQEISVSEWRGDATTLAQLKGKIVVLDFWATWCGPCMAVIPKNIDFINNYKDKGVALLGIHDAKSGWDSVDKVISEKGINYPVALDAASENSGATTKAYALKFWPTYFIIDRDGIVRGAGIKPDKIEEAVKQLLAETPGSAMSTAIAKATSIPDRWFLGGDKRLKAARESEGKKAPSLAIANWLGEEPDREDWNQRVRVIQFVRPELTTSVDQLAKLQSVAKRFAKQGVVFVAVCDARSSTQRMKTVAEEKRIDIPIAVDKSAEKDPIGIGLTAISMGIKFAPNTIVIDRSGVLRASGIKPDFLDSLLNRLLVESVAIEQPGSDIDINAVVEQPSNTNESKDMPKDLPAAQGANYAARPDAGQPPQPLPKPIQAPQNEQPRDPPQE